jgi:adenylate cyclase
MSTETERKFLVTNEDWRIGVSSDYFQQAYITTGPPASVRIRITNDTAILNIKQSTLDITRAEYEYQIPLTEAQEILNTLTTGHTIEKNRYTIQHQGLNWEIDEFLGQNKGLIIAELELDSEDQTFENPPWLGQEVSQDPRYFNTYLSQKPYTTW